MRYDVVIAGAGPVGVFLASELRLHKLSVLILEQLADPHSPLKGLPFGMRGLWGPSIQAFYRRDLLDKIAAQPEHGPAPRPGSTDAKSGPAGHFAGIQFDFSNIDSARWTYRLPGPSNMQLGVTMAHLERVLAEHALAVGVEIQRGVPITDFEAGADEVVINKTIHANWLVGCDGGRSTVRKRGGFEFAGTEPEFTGYSIEVEMVEPLPIGRHFSPTGMYTQWQPGVIAMCDFDGGKFHREVLTLEHVQSVLRRVSGTEVTLTKLKTAGTWTDRSMQATTYRRGRVLLAGDAAHVHSPLGGQGLNLGLGDAMNLGWKLAATIHGTAPEGLLDTYTTERHPIGERILDWTRAQVASMRPDRNSRALQNVLRDLINTQDGATYFAERVWNVTLRYDLGDPHPLVGRSCPDFELENATKIGTLLRDGQGLLLDFDRALEPLPGVHYVAGDVKDRQGLSAVLVRPDGFVACVTPTVDAMKGAAAKWVSQNG